MNRINFLLILALSLAFSGFSQTKPLSVPRITDVEYPSEWYGNQKKAWQKEVDKNPQNEDAWLNLYKAWRYHEFPKVFRDSIYKEEVNGVVDRMEVAIPNSFTFNFVKAWNLGNDEKKWEYLDRAHEIAPERPELLEDYVTRYEIEGKWDLLEEYCIKWYEAKTMAPTLLWSGYNILECTDENAILFSSGDNDTYPLMIMQNALKHRTDVAVMNIHLLMLPDYAEKVLKKNKLKYDPVELAKYNNQTKWPENVVNFVEHLAEKNPERPVYFVTTMQKKIVDEMEDDLWCVGLTYQYSKERVDKIALIKRNFETRLKMDYLEQGFYAEDYLFETYWGPRMKMMYLEPMALLYKHYLLAGENNQAAKYRNLSLIIARQAEREAEVAEYLDSLQTEVLPGK